MSLTPSGGELNRMICKAENERSEESMVQLPPLELDWPLCSTWISGSHQCWPTRPDFSRLGCVALSSLLTRHRCRDFQGGRRWLTRRPDRARTRPASIEHLALNRNRPRMRSPSSVIGGDYFPNLRECLLPIQFKERIGYLQCFASWPIGSNVFSAFSGEDCPPL